MQPPASRILQEPHDPVLVDLVEGLDAREKDRQHREYRVWVVQLVRLAQLDRDLQDLVSCGLGLIVSSTTWVAHPAEEDESALGGGFQIKPVV